MRNPLQAIVQLADGISRSMQVDTMPTALSSETIAKQNTESADTILACASHLQRVINDVLILSRIGSQMLTITPVISHIPHFLRETVKMFDGEVALHGTKIEIVKDESYNSLAVDHALCDTSRLAQILINLTSNAIKFMSSRKKRTISISYGAQSQRPPNIKTPYGELEWLQSQNDESRNVKLPTLEHEELPLYLYFCVQDTGPGVKPEEIHKLFQRFSQANERTHITHGGSGLGLYICRELAELQGGAVGIVSQLGEGSVFGFYIEARHASSPQNMVNTTPEPPAMTGESLAGQSLPIRLSTRNSTGPKERDADHKYTSTESAAATEAQPKSLRILLVEDNAINQKVLSKQLRNAGCAVTTANHGQDALDFMETTSAWRSASNLRAEASYVDDLSVDVILMDWEMPVMSGLECCKRIRTFEQIHKITHRLPIIAITANVRKEQISRALAAGMDSVMPKPFKVADLLEKIRGTLEAPQAP